MSVKNYKKKSDGTLELRYEVYTKSEVDNLINPENIISTTWEALKSLRDNSQLVPGKFYRITDYTCTVPDSYATLKATGATYNITSAGHQFDIIVLALETNKLSEEAWAAHHEGDTRFSSINLSAWKLWYCLDNDANRFDWARIHIEAYDTANSVTYNGNTYNRDSSRDTTYNNRPAYAFTRTVFVSMFNRSAYTLWVTELDTTQTARTFYLSLASVSGTTPPSTPQSWSSYSSAPYTVSGYGHVSEQLPGKGVIYRLIDNNNNDLPYDFKNILYDSQYTFNNTSYAYGDASLATEGSTNSCVRNIIRPYIVSGKMRLNTIVFLFTSITQNATKNFFGSGCINCTFTGSSLYCNTFGNSCTNISSTSSTIYNNTFGNNCSYIKIQSGGMNNTQVGNAVNNCTFKYCEYNTFGNGITMLEGSLRYSRIGNSCTYIKFGDSSTSLDYVRYVTIDNNCTYLYINSLDTTDSSSNYLQNIHIHEGVSGSSSSNRKTIEVPDRALTYSSDYFATNSEEYYV